MRIADWRKCARSLGALAFAQMLISSGFAADRAFTARYSTNDTGDIAIVANTLMTASSNGAQSGNAANVASIQNGTNGTLTNLNNNANYMVNVDSDADGTTFNSSSATLNLPASSTILFAGLYWGADTSAGAVGAPSIIAGAAAPNAAIKNQVKFATPAAGYATITASQVDTSTSSTTRFSCFTDVTALVSAAGNGVYTVGNVQAGTGADRFAGWSLAIVYRVPGLPPKNLVVFDGLQSVTTTNQVNIGISGFTAPTSGAVNFKMGLVTYEGDLGYTGDQLQVNSTNVSDGANPNANSFNSSISAAGSTVTTKSPNYVNQLGFDADMITLNNAGNAIIANGATSATINLTTSLDVYYPVVVTSAIDLYAPQITAVKTLTDLNGNNVTPGDDVEYTITISNTAGDTASNSILRDTIPANMTYVPGTIQISAGTNAGAKTDALVDDQGEFDSGNNRVVVRLGTGANGTTGGNMPIGTSATVKFRVKVNAGVPDGTPLNNQAIFSYSSLASGVALAASSNSASVNNSKKVQGTVFEDVNYGGGAGRGLATSSGVPRSGARIELYDGSGNFLSATTTGTSGVYSFADVAPGNYTMRCVSSTLASSRSGGGTPGLVPVQTFVNGDTARVGGEDPARVDAGNGSTTLAALSTASTVAQCVSVLNVGIADMLDVDFGFNFDTIVNTRDSGQGSLRQFITNANALGNAGLAQSGLVAGKDNAVFMISNGTAAAGLRAANNYFAGGVATIAPATALPAITDAVVMDATLQPGFSTTPVIELNGTGAGAASSGLAISAGNSTLRGLAINRFSQSGIALTSGGSNVIEGCYLGTNAAGTASSPNGQQGVYLNGSSNNTIGGTSAGAGNLISGNTTRGVRVVASSGNRITRNSIFANTGVGIDLGTDGLTPNTGVLGGAANNGMNYPIVTSAMLNGSNLTLRGYIGSAPGQSAFGSASVEIFKADNSPADQGGQTISGDGLNLPHGEGRTYLGTITAASDGTFNTTISVSGLAVGDTITSTATDASSNTSEFGTNALVTSFLAGDVSGFVYLDANHNSQKDGSEAGTGLTLSAKIFPSNTSGPAQQAVVVNVSTGAYSFSNIAPGSYTIVIDDNSTLSDVTPVSVAGWSGTEFSSRSRSPIAVASAPVNDLNFGLINALPLSGNIFADNGAGGGGVANDGVKNGSESGFAGVSVKVTDNGGATVYDTATTNANGDYVLLLPQSLTNGTILKIVETNAANTISTGGSAGTTGGSYNRASDTVTFSFSRNTTYSGVNFGDVTAGIFSTDGAQTNLPGSFVVHPHTFTAGSAGQVTFSTSDTSTPSVAGWTVTLHADANGNGTIDANEPAITAPVSVTAGQNIALLAKVFIPANAPFNAQEKLTVSANFAYTNASPALSANLQRTDITTVGNPTTAGLTLSKSVDKATARPGEVLTYTITYTNNSSEALENVIVYDSTPAYTTFVSASNGALPQSLTGVTLTAPAAGGTGAIRWNFAGMLAPGGTGTVAYRVTVAQ